MPTNDENLQKFKELYSKIKSGEITPKDVARGYTVTQRIKQIKQPRGGYINPRMFVKLDMTGGGIDDLYPEENVSPTLVGIAVDYLTRFMTGSTVEEAFEIPRRGAVIVRNLDLYKELIEEVKGLDEKSICAAVKLAGFDSAYRAGLRAYTPVEDIDPDAPTIGNIRKMVERSLRFFDQYGPKVLDGLTFEGGYTDIVVNGDGDFLTGDTLWDFKVSKQGLQSNQTLQLLMYWRMGLHSIHPEYRNVRYLGIYNPRQNVVYRLDVNDIPDEVISEVESQVIGYPD